ncbi:hypothetical protein Tco_0662253 [Tanacetum coccineum]
MRLGRYAVESYLEQILSHGFFQADPGGALGSGATMMNKVGEESFKPTSTVPEFRSNQAVLEAKAKEAAKDTRKLEQDLEEENGGSISRCLLLESLESTLQESCSKLQSLKKQISSMGSEIMASCEDCLDGEGEVKVESMGGGVVLGVGQGEVKGGGVDFRVINSLLGEILGEVMGEME